MYVPPTPFKMKDWEKCDCTDRPGLDDSVRANGARTETGAEKAYRLEPSHGTMEEDLSTLSEHLESPPLEGKPFLLVTHAPPMNTALDCLGDGRHVGSLAVRRFIERWGATGRLGASFHGHIHESPWVSGRVSDRIGGVPSFNAGQQPTVLRGLLFQSEDVGRTVKLITVESSSKKGHGVSVKELGLSL